MLAEAICISALQSTQIQFLDKAKGGNRGGFFRWFQKPESVQSKDSAIILSKLFEDEIVENARSLLDNYNLMKDGFKPVKIKSGHHWWKPSCYEKLEKIGGSDFSAWASEYVPAYRLEIDTKIVGDIKTLKKTSKETKGQEPLSVFQDHPSSVPLLVERRLGQSSKSVAKLLV